MVGVKTWTEDGIWFVLLASKILSPSSTQKSKPGRFFTDEAIGLLCKKNIKDLRHTPNAASVRYARTQKPEAQPSPAVLEIIEQLRSSISQAQDSTNGSILENPRHGTMAPKDEVPQEVLAILVQIRCQQYQWALSLRRNLEESTIGIVAKLLEVPQEIYPYGRGHENGVLLANTYQQQHGSGPLGNGSRRQQPRQVHSAMTRSTPLWYPGAEVSSLMRQAKGNGQEMNAYMQNGGGALEYSQHTSPGTMYQFYGNQMGPDTPPIQSYGHETPMDSPHSTNYGNYTQGLSGLGINGIPIPTGPIDVGTSSYPHGAPSYGQFNACMMPQNRRFYGETVPHDGLPSTNQYSPQQQYSTEYPFPPSNVDLDGMEVVPQRSHGLSQVIMNDSNFANLSPLGLAQSIFTSPSDISGSSNDFIEPLDSQSKSNDLEEQGVFTYQVEIISQEPQPSVSTEKGKKRSVDEAEISDINSDGSYERRKKKHNSQDKDCSEQLNSNDQNARYARGLSEKLPDNARKLCIAASSGSPIDSSVIALDVTSGAVVASGVDPATHSLNEAGLSPISTNLTIDSGDPTNTKVNDSPHEMPSLKSQGIFHESVEIFPHQEDVTATRNSNGIEDESLSVEDFLGHSDYFDDIYYSLTTSFHEMSDEVIQANYAYLLDQI
ncbi:hypothetical protein H4I95_01402 [Botrytis cinerea]